MENFELAIFEVLNKYPLKIAIHAAFIFIIRDKDNFFHSEHPIQSFFPTENSSLTLSVYNYFRHFYLHNLKNNYFDFQKNLRDSCHFLAPPNAQFVGALVFRITPKHHSEFVPSISDTVIPQNPPLFLCSSIRQHREFFIIDPAIRNLRIINFLKIVFETRLFTQFNRSNPTFHIYQYSLLSNFFRDSPFSDFANEIKYIFDSYHCLIRSEIILTHVFSRNNFFELKESVLREFTTDPISFTHSEQIIDFLNTEFVVHDLNFYCDFFENLSDPEHRSAPLHNLITAAITFKIFPESPNSTLYLKFKHEHNPTPSNPHAFQ